MANRQRLKVLEARDQALQELLQECRKRLPQAATGKYNQLMQQLLLQSLLNLMPTAADA